MARFDSEVLTMNRCKTMLEKLPLQSRKRVAEWLLQVAMTGAELVPVPDPRQENLFE